MVQAPAHPELCGINGYSNDLPNVKLIGRNTKSTLEIKPPPASKSIPLNSVCKIRIDSSSQDKVQMSISPLRIPNFIRSIHIIAVDE